MNRWALATTGVLSGTIGVALVVRVLANLAQRLPIRYRRSGESWAFIGPALTLMSAILIVPGVLTVVNSFRDARSERFVGLDNYRWLISDAQVRSVLANNLLWLMVVPAFTLAWSLTIAVLADRLSGRWEGIAKSVIFLPVAISLVGASTIWGFVYAVRPEGRDQIGVLNAILSALGIEPVAWLLEPTVNDFALMAIMIWLETGFGMVVLSAAIKAVPSETIEAARIDGANERQVLWAVVLPQIRSTMLLVYTTVLISTLKVFDVVSVLTSGNFGTDVIAHRFIIELFRFRDYGRAAAIVVVLMLATTPFMWLNYRFHRREDLTR